MTILIIIILILHFLRQFWRKMDAQTTGDITKFTAQKETDSTAAPFRHQKEFFFFFPNVRRVESINKIELGRSVQTQDAEAFPHAFEDS
jgi:hypothetical protein